MPYMVTRWLLMVFGDGEEHYVQAHACALTLLAYAPEPRQIVLATNQPHRFTWLSTNQDVVISPITQDMLNAWKGPHSFFWRVKLECIRAHVQQASTVIYVDSDTLVRKNLQDMVTQLHDGHVMMHEPEQTLSHSSRSGDRRLWKNLNGQSFTGIRVDTATTMWNAGVVGIGSTSFPLLNQSIAICDQLCDRIGNHSLNEQFALSLALGSSSRLTAARPWIDHYWGNKPDYLILINQYLAKFLSEGMIPLHAADWMRDHPIILPLHVKRPKWKKWIIRKLGMSSIEPLPLGEKLHDDKLKV